VDLLCRPGRVARQFLPSMVIERRWDEPAAYLAALPRKRRQHLRVLRDRIAADPGLRVGWQPAVPPAEAAALAHAVRLRHRRTGWVVPPIPVGYFTALGRLPDARFLTYTDAGERVLAYMLVHDTGTDLLASLWAAGDGATGLYLDSYPRLVEELIRLGRDRLVVGKGMTWLKGHLGATPSPRYTVVGR
jgi:hypothetical protein